MIKLRIKVQALIDYFHKHRFECYVVGGFVRDQLLKKPITTGVDFTTNATPKQMLTILSEGKYENRFGTVIFQLENIAQKLKIKQDDYLEKDFFEITTFRTEQGYSDKRHPDKINWGKSLIEDLQRRDFTVNALAFDGTKLFDQFNGQKDLKAKIIRTVGQPQQRFSEDALRLMRAIRFASQLGFQIEPNTLMAIQANAKLLKQISIERVRDEFLKILASDNATNGIALLRNTDLTTVFIPELNEAFGVGQVSPKRHHIDDVGTHLLKTLNACTNPDPIVRLACLLHDIGKPKTREIQSEGIITFYNHEIVGTEMAYKIGQRLKLSKKDLHRLTKLVRYHQFSVNENQTDRALRRFIRNVGKNNLQNIIDLRIADRIGSGAKPSSWRTELFLKRLEEVQKKPFTVHDLKINGQDVMKICQLKPGPKVGEKLNQVFKKIEINELPNERKALLTYLKKLNDTFKS